jgi:CheY-like chemotaxis protein
LSNAVKFTPEEGSITLSAKLLSELPDDMCRIEISVADNGIGLTEEQTGRIFNSFEQAEVGISRTYGGAGLGLSISKRIVEMMGGKIWVESEADKGAKFSFTVKMRRMSGSEPSQSKEISRNGARNFTAYGVSQDFSGHTVLLAEDVEINREIVLALLEPMKLNVECAENGAEALRMFEENPERYDMIFMDIQMPVMDGYETTRRIRALESTRAKEIPIVAMTANVFKEDIERCLESGMNSHVGKPLIINEVAESLRKYLMS